MKKLAFCHDGNEEYTLCEVCGVLYRQYASRQEAATDIDYECVGWGKKTVTIIVKNAEDDYESFTLDVEDADYKAFCIKHRNEGCSVRGTLAEVLEELQ